MSTVATTIATQFTAVDRFTQVVKKMQMATMSFAQKTTAGFAMVERAERKLRNGISKTIGSLGQLGLAFGSAMVARKVITPMIKFDESLASLKAITGLTGKEFEPFKAEIFAIGDATKKSFGDIAKAMELLGSLDSTLLNNAKDMGLMTRASILLSKASGSELPDAAQSLASILKIYGANANEAARYVDILSTSEQKGTYTVAALADGLKTVGGTARVLGLNVDETSALLQALAPSSKSVEVASTGLNAILNKLGTTTGKFNPKIVGSAQAFQNLADANLTLADAQKMVGGERAGMLLSLVNQNKVIQELSNNQYIEGNAQKQASERAVAFTERIKNLTDKFDNLMVKGNESSGVLNKFGVILVFVTNNLGAILGILGSLIVAYVGYRAILIGAKVATFLYNIAIGVHNALLKKSLFYIQGNKIAMVADLITTKLVTAGKWLLNTAIIAGTIGIVKNTAVFIANKAAMIATVVATKAVFLVTKVWIAAQWLLNAALTANPIGLIIVAIAALIALVVLVIAKWNEWGAALSLFMGPIGMIISIVQSFRRNWEMVKESFASGGILGGLKAIGKVLLDAVLMPIQQLLELLAKIPGVGKMFGKGAANIQAFREKLGVNTTTDEKGQPLNADATAQSVQTQRIETTKNDKIEIGVTATNGASANVRQNTGVPVLLTNTVGWQQ